MSLVAQGCATAPRQLTMPDSLHRAESRCSRSRWLPCTGLFLATLAPAQEVLSIPTSEDGKLQPPPGMTLEGVGIIDTLAGGGTPGGRGELSFPRSVAVDPAGNVYVADTRNHRIRQIDTTGLISRFAGTGEDGESGDGGPAIEAELCYPAGVATDTAGNVYVADRWNHRVRRIDTEGTIATVAGTGSPGGNGDGGPAIEAQLAYPVAVATDPSGNLYIAEGGSHRIRKVNVDGVITRFAGTGRAGYSGDGAAARARLANPAGVAADAAGNVYVADTWNHRIRRVDASGVISTVAGTGDRADGGDGGPAAAAQLAYPAAVAAGPAGSLYVVTYVPSTGNRRIRKIGADGMISAFAGTGGEGYAGDADPAPAAQLAHPLGVAVDAEGNVYIADARNARVRVVRPGLQLRVELGSSGESVALVVSAGGIFTRGGQPVLEGSEVNAGNGNTYALTKDTNGLVAATYMPESQQVRLGATGGVTLTRDEDGTWRIGGEPVENGHLHMLGGKGFVLELAEGSWGLADYVIETVAGTVEVAEGIPGTSVPLASPTNVAVDAVGNVYFAERFGHRIRKIDAAGMVTTYAGTGNWGYSGDGGSASRAQLHSPAGMAVDNDGNLYVAEREGHRVRRIDTSGTITTYAGTGEYGFGGDGGPAIQAQFGRPSGIAIDAEGILYVSSRNGQLIRRIDIEGVITTLAGAREEEGDDGDGGPASLARIAPTGIAVDSAGRVYVAQRQYHRVRRIDTKGVITGFAGTGEQGYGGDGGPAIQAQFDRPRRVAVDATGNVYVTDGDNRRVRKIDTAGVITTSAGTGDCCYDGDGGPALQARLNQPSGIAIDATSNVYVTDRSNHRIHKIDTAGVISTIAGTDEEDRSEEAGPASQARFRGPSAVALSMSGDLFFADDSRVWKLDATGLITPLSCCRGRVSDLAVDSTGRVFAAEIYSSRIQLIDSAGEISTFAGTGDRGYGGDDGPATEARLNRPCSVAVDRAGNVYVAERDNHRIRKIDVSGVISTFAGTGTRGDAGNGGPAVEAQLDSLCGALATDALGNVYVAERWSRRIRRIDTAGVITTFATLPDQLERPVAALTAAEDGSLFVGGNRQVLRIDPKGSMIVIAGTREDGYRGDGGPARSAGLSVLGLAVNRFGDVWLADVHSRRIRVLRRQ